jgi:glucose-6-phosphate isomerase
MLEATTRFAAAGLDFAQHAVAVTGNGSELDEHATVGGWLARFPMFDWIGGRTSVMSAVGLLPAALQGIDIEQFLAGAAAMDARTREPETRQNAAMLLALMWFHAGNGRGEKDMVILPYKDRLLLFSRYLQQLVMESLGKEKDLAGTWCTRGSRSTATKARPISTPTCSNCAMASRISSPRSSRCRRIATATALKSRRA